LDESFLGLRSRAGDVLCIQNNSICVLYYVGSGKEPLKLVDDVIQGKYEALEHC
jgi:hypothetical protein